MNISVETVTVDGIENNFVHYHTDYYESFADISNFPNVRVGQTWKICLNGFKIFSTILVG